MHPIHLSLDSSIQQCQCAQRYIKKKVRIIIIIVSNQGNTQARYHTILESIIRPIGVYFN